jgi:glycosyltransferase involved in cell wall biosynthesis
MSRARSLPLRALDGALAVIAAATCACALLARHMLGRRTVRGGERRLLVLNTSYSLHVLRARGAEHLVTHRDLAGYFEHVWSVHPLVGASPDEPPGTAAGAAAVTPLGERHTMVEGKVRRLAALDRLPLCNFVLAQASLLVAIDRIVRTQRVGVVRGDPYYCGLLALLMARLHGCAVELRVIANHDAIYETTGRLVHSRLFRRRRVEQAVARFTVSRADRIVIGTEDYRPFARAHGAIDERISCIGNWGMINPLHLQEPRDRAPHPELDRGGRPLVVCVSRLEREKYPQDVVVSLAKVRATHPQVLGVIVGDGALRAELERLCAELGVQDDVLLAGDRDQRWIAAALAQATVVAAPMAGLALVEAALSATPIVAYDVEWHAELICSGETGILVPFRDTAAMAAAICALIDEPDHAASLAARARARVLETMEPGALLAREREQAAALIADAGRRSGA